jgi:hypothetical protein
MPEIEKSSQEISSVTFSHIMWFLCNYFHSLSFHLCLTLDMAKEKLASKLNAK